MQSDVLVLATLLLLTLGVCVVGAREEAKGMMMLHAHKSRCLPRLDAKNMFDGYLLHENSLLSTKAEWGMLNSGHMRLSCNIYIYQKRLVDFII